MSCQQCSYITGHDPQCSHYHEDRQRDQDDLRARIDGLESRLDQLEKLVLDYAHLKKLYGESRDYVGALTRERDDLVEASKRGVAEQDRLDALVERMRPVYEAAKAVRSRLPASAGELGDAVDRAIAAESTPYRGAP